MPDITKLDKNFRTNSNLPLDDILFFNPKENPWCIYGLGFDHCFYRMPKEIAKDINIQVSSLCQNTSGGRIRFSTSSPFVALICNIPEKVSFSHMATNGISGFDVYIDGEFVNSIIPPNDFSQGYEGIIYLQKDGPKEVMIHFPLYNNVEDVYVGIKKGCYFEKPAPYKYDKKLLFYGSSITQGGCASRPGLSYPAIVSSQLQCDFLNLGFSSGALGETKMAEYISGLNPDIFIMDYDHNAPTKEHLAHTHEKFFKTFRKHHSDVPVVFVSAPNVRFQDIEWQKRRDIIFTTFKNAKNSGDTNVYFIDGSELWGDSDWRFCTVDALHPNDMGHYRMAKCIIPTIKQILEKL